MDSLERLLKEIVNKSRFLSEVITSTSAETINLLPSVIASSRLERWRQTAARGDVNAFARRLFWDDLDHTNIELVLGGTIKQSVSDLPEWARVIESVMRSASATIAPLSQSTSADLKAEHQRSAANCLDPEQPIAFEELLLPAVNVAREQLQARLGLREQDSSQPPTSLLSQNAYWTLERSLLKRLGYLVAQVLGREFSQFRPAGLSLAGTLGIETDEPPHVYYDAFVKKLLVDGYMDLFRRYPVLARLIAVAIQQWVETCADFIRRVDADLPMLTDFTAQTEGALIRTTPHRNVRIDSLETDLSDPHDGGKTVISFKLNTGMRLVYKPKSLCLESSYYNFLQWCNSNAVPLDFAVPRVLDRGVYGWMEYVENIPCNDFEGVQRFYIRAGMLLCVLYILGATDCHFENLVAQGEHPVLVDAETLLHPEARPSSGETDQERFDSVLRTGMLPHWECWQKTSVLRDASALGSTDPEGLPSPVWHRINTDEMYLRWTSIKETNLKHRPRHDAKQADPEDYVEQFLNGFRNMALFLSAEQERLLAADGPLSLFKSIPVRFIFRPTNIYYRVLRSALSPDYLGNGIDWGIEIERLAYAFLADEAQPVGWQLLALEMRSLERLDIPYFMANSGSTFFHVATNGEAEQIFRVSSYDQAVKRLKAFNTDEVGWQVEVITGAFEAKQLVLHHNSDERQKQRQHKHGTNQDADKAGRSLLPPDQFLTKAQSIASELERRAIAMGRDGLNWLGWSYLPDGRHLQLDLLGHSLYDGRCGVALFFAALYAITGTPQYLDVTERTISTLKELLQFPNSTRTRRWARNMGIGGIGGLGSVIYLLVKFAQLLKDPLILEQALKSADLLSLEEIDSDEDFDILNGSAGALIALLTLYDRTADRNVLRLAEHCGNILIQRRVVIAKGIAGWQSKTSSRPLTGFSHGAAGISYALLRLYEATQGQHFLEVAQEALNYERSTFSLLQSNWPDYRTFVSRETTPSYSCSWCHGAPGIALARLASLRIVDEPKIRQDIEIALNRSLSALKHEELPSDHVCCGNFGLVEILLVGSTILERPSLGRDAIHHASNLCQRAERVGSFRLLGRTPRAQRFFSPTFFQGMAGIGYTLLRLSRPEVLPSITLLE